MEEMAVEIAPPTRRKAPPIEPGTATKRSFPASQNRFASLTGPASKGPVKPSMGPNSGLFAHGGWIRGSTVERVPAGELPGPMLSVEDPAVRLRFASVLALLVAFTAVVAACGGATTSDPNQVLSGSI